MAKTEVATNLVGSVAYPRLDIPHAWPFATALLPSDMFGYQELAPGIWSKTTEAQIVAVFLGPERSCQVSLRSLQDGTIATGWIEHIRVPKIADEVEK